MRKTDVEILERRLNHLRRRIAENPERNLSYDKAEAGALERVLMEAIRYDL